MQPDFEHYLFELVVALLQQEFYLQGYIPQYPSLSLLVLPEQYEGLSLPQLVLSYCVGVKSLQESYELQLQQFLLAVLLVLFELVSAQSVQTLFVKQQIITKNVKN